MTWVDLFVGISAIVGAAFMVAVALGALCGVWWHVLTRVRRCAYETYLLADMRRWMKERGHD